MNEQEIISKYMADMSRKGHKKSPRSKEFYSKIGKIGLANRWGKLKDNKPI
jgi:hypothetical protein